MAMTTHSLGDLYGEDEYIKLLQQAVSENVAGKVEIVQVQTNTELFAKIEDPEDWPDVLGIFYGLRDALDEYAQDRDILRFMLSRMRARSLDMGGQHRYAMDHSGWPMSHAKGPTAREAMVAAMKEQEKHARKVTDD